MLSVDSLSGLPNIPELMSSQWGQPGVPAASDQRLSEVATHWGLRHGGPSETDVRSSVNTMNSVQYLYTIPREHKNGQLE